MGYFKTDNVELRKMMTEKEIMTTKELAEKSGINRNTLAMVLKGRQQPSSEVMEKLVIALDIEPEKAGTIFFSQSLRNAKEPNQQGAGEVR